MKEMYLDMSDNNCISVFSSDCEIVPVGITVNAMPVKDRNEEYTSIATNYNIHFIFDDKIPVVDFYPVPYIDIFATDDDNGFIGTLGEVSDLTSNAPICYIDKKRNCFVLASNFRELLQHLDQWKANKQSTTKIVVFTSKNEVMKTHEFIDLTRFDEQFTEKTNS